MAEPWVSGKHRPKPYIFEASGESAKPLSYMEQNKYTIPFYGRFV